MLTNSDITITINSIPDSSDRDRRLRFREVKNLEQFWELTCIVRTQISNLNSCAYRCSACQSKFYFHRRRKIPWRSKCRGRTRPRNCS